MSGSGDRLRCAQCGARSQKKEGAQVVATLAATFVAAAAVLAAVFATSLVPLLGLVLAPLVGFAISLCFPLQQAPSAFAKRPASSGP
jgi:hypothetical protein